MSPPSEALRSARRKGTIKGKCNTGTAPAFYLVLQHKPQAGDLENTHEPLHKPCLELQVRSAHGQKDNAAPIISCELVGGNQLHPTVFIHVGIALRKFFCVTGNDHASSHHEPSPRDPATNTNR